MQQDNWEDFRREMALLCEAFDRKSSKDLDEAYWSALTKMPIQNFRRAAKFAREKSGQEGFERLPKPGKFWSLSDEARRADRPRNEIEKPIPLTREAHIAHMRHIAIEAAKRETMPNYKGMVTRTLPEHVQASFDLKWREWDDAYGQQPIDYWLPRAEQLITMWSGSKPAPINFADTLKNFG